MRKAWHHAAQHLEKLRTGVGRQVRKSSDIASGVCQALHEPVAYRVDRITHDDGYRVGRFLCGAGGDPSCGHDDVHFQSHQVVRQARKAFGSSRRPIGIRSRDSCHRRNRGRSSRREYGLQVGFLAHSQKSDAPDLALLLTESVGRRAKCKRACSKCNENFSAIGDYAPLVGYYARLRQGQQTGGFSAAGGCRSDDRLPKLEGAAQFPLVAERCRPVHPAERQLCGVQPLFDRSS